MKNLIKTTLSCTSALDVLRVKRMSTVSITDKAMTSVAIDNIGVGELDGITFFEVVDEETGEVNNQVVFTLNSGDNYSTCSKVAYSLADDLYNLVANGDCKLDDIGLAFSISNSRAGNKYLGVNIA